MIAPQNKQEMCIGLAMAYENFCFKVTCKKNTSKIHAKLYKSTSCHSISNWLEKNRLLVTICKSIPYWIRAVTGQPSSPESCFANKTKIIYTHKKMRQTSLDFNEA